MPQRRVRTSRACAVCITLAVSMSACVVWTAETRPVDVVLAEHTEPAIRVTPSGRDWIVLYEPRVRQAMVVGYLRRPNASRGLYERQPYDTAVAAVKLADIIALDVRRLAPKRSVMVLAGGACIVAWARGFFY